jgi:hypothetical protein
MKKILYIVLLLPAPFIISMEKQEDDTKLCVYTIPGQNGLGSERAYVTNLLGIELEQVVPIETPQYFADLGQSNCINYLRTAVSKHNHSNEIEIVHATSQGTATALNYLAHEDKGKRVKGLILEATLASGNSAILHTIKGPLMDMPAIANLPLSYYWIPYIAKCLMPAYWPAGKQPINSIINIPTHIPIVITHSKYDPQLAYTDACALYYGLRAKGNNNTYLITKGGNGHINIMDSDSDKKIIAAILNKHKLVNNAQQEKIDLSPYQPDYLQFKELYNSLVSKEEKHKYLGYSLGVGATTAAICLPLWRFVG